MECSYPLEPVSVVCFPQWRNADSVRKHNRMVTTARYLGHMYSRRNEEVGKVTLFPEFSQLSFDTSINILRVFLSYTSTETFPVRVCGRYGLCS